MARPAPFRHEPLHRFRCYANGRRTGLYVVVEIYGTRAEMQAAARCAGSPTPRSTVGLMSPTTTISVRPLGASRG